MIFWLGFFLAVLILTSAGIKLVSAHILAVGGMLFWAIETKD